MIYLKYQLAMHNIRVIVIEDNRYTSKVLRMSLKKMGFEVVSVYETAEEALERLNEFSADVIVSDLKLSTEMNGFHAGQQFRELINTPIVYYSGTVNDDMIDNCLSLGNVRFVPKTASIIEVEKAIRELVNRNDLQQAS